MSTIWAVVDFAFGTPVVEQAPSCLREAGADGGFVAGWEVALDDEHVFEDFVRLGEELDDTGDFIAVIHPLCPVSIGDC